MHGIGRPPVKLTFDGHSDLPLWTTDGRRLVYASNASPMRLLSGLVERDQQRHAATRISVWGLLPSSRLVGGWTRVDRGVEFLLPHQLGHSQDSTR